MQVKKIKILVDARWFDSYYSGVTTYIKGLYMSLSKYPEFEITIIGRNIEKLKYDFPSNVSYIEMNSSTNFKWLFIDIPNIIEKHGFDYAHFQYISPFVKKCKYIVTLHDLLFLDFKKSFPLTFVVKNRILFYFSALKSDLLLTVSEYSKDRISYHFKIKSDKIHVIPNGILEGFKKSDNLNILSKYNIDKYILYVSRIEPRKNHISLLKAFVELKLYQNYSLVFIGKKTINVLELNDYLSALSSEILSKVIFIDNVSESDLNEFYSNASLFVYPSISEGFGIPPIESIMLGTKTICSNATALSDFHFFDNYFFSPTDISELKKKILFTLNDDNYPIDLFQVIISKKYNWDSISYKLRSLIINDYESKS